MSQFHTVPIASLHLDPNNARLHPDDSIDALAQSLTQFGQPEPLVVQASRNRVIAGNGRLEAMQKLGWTHVDVRLVDWDDRKAMAYALASNGTSELSIWDVGRMTSQLDDLKVDFDLSGMGFDDKALAKLEVEGADDAPAAQDAVLDVDALDDPEIPDVPVDPVSRRGDVWTLGAHRLMCGDAMSAADVAKLMGGEKAALVFTSPPYAQQRDYGAKITDWEALMRGVFSVIPASPSTQLLVNLGLIHKDGELLPYWDPWVTWMRKAGWRQHGWYVWDKLSGMPGAGGGRPASCHEWIFHLNKKTRMPNKTMACKLAGQSAFRKNPRAMASSGGPGKGSSFADPDAVYSAQKIPDSVFRTPAARTTGKVEAAHPAVFPVALAAMMLTAYSDAGDACYEPFSGSGTSVLAAEQLGRRCYAMDIEPAYVDIAVARWEKLTGRKAERQKAAA